MTHSLSITYLACQTCHARICCDDCEKRLEAALMRIQGINGASIRIAAKQVLVEGPIDADTLEEVLENLGIFIA